mgnify:CR=1 FL=1
MKFRSPLRRVASARKDAGFSLVEILVVMLIMSGILVTITQLLNGARTTRDQIHNIQETQLAGPAILDRVERDLRGLFTYDRNPFELLRVRDRVSAGLDADSLEFVTANTALMVTEDIARHQFLRPDYVAVGYVLRANPALDDFLEMYRRESFGIGESVAEGGRYGFLHDRIRGFDIKVFEDDGPDADPLDDWCDGDRDQKGLPARIEITLSLELSPRLVEEQSAIALTERRLLQYRRVIRFPENLRHGTTVQPVALIPDIQKPADGPIGGDVGGDPGQPGIPGAPGQPGGPPAFGPDPFNPSSGGGGAIPPNPFGIGGG